MASQWPNNPDSVLRGMLGNLVSAAESGGRGAANMWSAIHSAANDWASGVLAVTNPTPPTPEEISAKAQQLIGHITIQDVNRYSHTVGEFLRARANLASLGPQEQITGNAVFNPPWARTTGNAAVPTRYRIRVLRSITVKGFTSINREEWASYEVTGPLTSAADALNQANSLFSQSDYNSRASINSILDYTIEAI